jgi:nickel/cobalt transporter (NicO) family protein
VRTLRRLVGLAALTGAALLVAPAAASAHPLGNFTINTYDGIVVVPGEVRVDYVLDMAEIPTFEAMGSIDANGDGTATAAELSAYAARRARVLVHGVAVTAARRPVPLAVRSSSARFRPGQAGLHILRLEAVFVGRIGASGTLSLTDRTYASHIGWHEVTAVGASGTVVTHSDVPVRSISDALLHYPKDLLSNPLDVTSGRVSFAPGRSAAAPVLGRVSGGGRPGVTGGPFARLATWSGLSFPALLLALVLAAAFGAGHALLPGHGKTLMAAYLVGEGGRLRQAGQVGVAVAFMHTASVLALGLAILGLQVIAPDRIYPWVTLATGVLVLGMGTGLAALRTRQARGTRPHGHDHAADHAHDHSHAHHRHGPGTDDRPLSRRGLAGLAVAGGILPSPTAIVVLLATFSGHRAGFGLALIMAFSVGMAAALIGVGALALRARRMVARRLSEPLFRALPVATALVIVVVGAVLVVKGASGV